ncbi:hypothetical protein SOPP22_04720 [Shewanella sp. OPT22]|nr:hypothetical protein SOPP22_04720 [Shewanella sp. OPT22]
MKFVYFLSLITLNVSAMNNDYHFSVSDLHEFNKQAAIADQYNPKPAYEFLKIKVKPSLVKSFIQSDHDVWI